MVPGVFRKSMMLYVLWLLHMFLLIQLASRLWRNRIDCLVVDYLFVGMRIMGLRRVLRPAHGKRGGRHELRLYPVCWVFASTRNLLSVLLLSPAFLVLKSSSAGQGGWRMPRCQANQPSSFGWRQVSTEVGSENRRGRRRRGFPRALQGSRGASRVSLQRLHGEGVVLNGGFGDGRSRKQRCFGRDWTLLRRHMSLEGSRTRARKRRLKSYS